MKPRGRIGWGLILLVVMGAAVGIAHWPVSTRYGINYRLYEKKLPLYEKGLDFLNRHLKTRRLVEKILQDVSGDRAKLLRLFAWVVENVRPVPEGFPVVDDHLLHVILRGYGASDQRTEVFALLASYAGFPAARVQLRPPGQANQQALLQIAVVEIGDRWVLMDPSQQLLFINPQGGFYSVQDLILDPDRISSVAAGRRVEGIPYEDYFHGLDRLQPIFLRMEQQKPWPRLKSELSNFFLRFS